MRAIGRIGKHRLPVEIDANGKAVAVGRGAASVSGPQRLSERVGTTKPETSTVVPPGVALSSPAYRSKWEPIYAAKLDMEQKAGLIQRWWYEPAVLYLEDPVPDQRRKRHKPDFWIWRVDGSLKIVAVKGYHKNIRESLTIIRWAAQRYPFAEWAVTWLRKGDWEEEPIRSCLLTNR